MTRVGDSLRWQPANEDLLFGVPVSIDPSGSRCLTAVDLSSVCKTEVVQTQHVPIPGTTGLSF